MSVTSADVARVAGVSRATVSYVLNDTPGRVLTPETRQRVLQAVAELGYRPNLVARSLKRGRTDNVVLPLPGLQLSYPLSQFVKECTSALQPTGLTLIPDFSKHSDPAQQVEAWLARSPAAVLDILLRHDDAALMRLRQSNVTVLSTGMRSEPGWESSGDAFAREQRVSQAKFLLDCGHTCITAIYPRTLPIDPRGVRALLNALRRLAVKSGARIEVLRLDLHEVAEHLSRLHELPTAFACHDDDYAVATLTALQHRGIHIPEQVAVMGIDDLPIAAVVTPAITTIRPDFSEFGAGIARSVAALLRGEQPTGALPQVLHQVVRRQSTH